MNKITKYVLMFAVGATVLCSCNKKSDTAATGTEVAKKQQVRVESVYAEDVEQLYEYTAIVQAEAVNNIAPTIAGRIEAIYVEVGRPRHQRPEAGADGRFQPGAVESTARQP